MEQQLNKVLKSTNYSVKKVSWNDVSRYTGINGLSSVGSNITDVKLVGYNDEEFYTIRTDNWNEKIGTVSAQDVAIITETNNVLEPITLKKYLVDNNLYSEKLDTKISIRFQTTFLPLKSEKSIEFCTKSYSYNTPTDNDPKNLLLLSTTQGLTLHTNKNKYQNLFLQSKDANGKLVNRWLEAEETSFKVGSEQIETDEQVKANKKASSCVIGIKSMGQRFNALLTIQIPLKQKQQQRVSKFDDITMYKQMYTASYSCGPEKCMYRSCESDSIGVSSAARVSKGSVALEEAKEIDMTKLTRSDSEHITITVILYNVVKGGVPSEDDIIAAVAELDKLYSSCSWSGNLKDISASNIIPSKMDNKKVSFPENIYDVIFNNRLSFPT